MRPLIRKHPTKTPQERLYTLVDAINLTPNELRASKLSDAYLYSVWMDFTNNDKRYQTVHVNGHPKGYIILSGSTKDKVDLKNVESIVSRETRGKSREEITDRGIDICSYIDLTEDPTQSRVADFAEIYSTHFKNVIVSHTYFRNVPGLTLKNSGLPLHKLC